MLAETIASRKVQPAPLLSAFELTVMVAAFATDGTNNSWLIASATQDLVNGFSGGMVFLFIFTVFFCA